MKDQIDRWRHLTAINVEIPLSLICQIKLRFVNANVYTEVKWQSFWYET